LEKARHGRPEELPLFAQLAPAVHDSGIEPAPLPDAPPDALRNALDEVDPDRLTPRDAVEILYRLKALAAVPPARPEIA
jgi:DNA mismatch repair protein MutS